AGLIPCTAPSSRIMTAGMLISGMALPSVRVRRSRRVRRGVATREPDLVRPVALLQLQQEALVERDAATRQHVELGHPAADAIRVELRVPRAVERVRDVDPSTIPADLHHLGPPVQRLLRIARVCGAPAESAV